MNRIDNYKNNVYDNKLIRSQISYIMIKKIDNIKISLKMNKKYPNLFNNSFIL
jgi:hypothetical protein